MKYTNKQQEAAIVKAAQICGLDTHMWKPQRKRELKTWADMIAGRWYRDNMPIKRSYLFCDTLDVDFFFTEDGTAVFTYAGYCYSATEASKLSKAIITANKMREQMQILIENEEIEND